MRARVGTGLAAAILVAAGCATGPPGFHYGENLMQNLPPEARGWSGYHKQGVGAIEHYVWTDAAGVTVVALDIVKGKTGSAEMFRADDENYGKGHCKPHASETLDSSTRDGYPSVTWYSICGREDGTTLYLLQRAITGRDSFYLMRRVWFKEPGADEFAAARKLLLESQLCDTRRTDVECPSGWTPVTD